MQKPRTSFTLSSEKMLTDALARATSMGYGSFSEYIRYLVEQDLAERPPHYRIEKGASASPSKKKNPSHATDESRVTEDPPKD